MSDYIFLNEIICIDLHNLAINLVNFLQNTIIRRIYLVKAFWPIILSITLYVASILALHSEFNTNSYSYLKVFCTWYIIALKNFLIIGYSLIGKLLQHSVIHTSLFRMSAITKYSVDKYPESFFNFNGKSSKTLETTIENSIALRKTKDILVKEKTYDELHQNFNQLYNESPNIAKIYSFREPYITQTLNYKDRFFFNGHNFINISSKEIANDIESILISNMSPFIKQRINSLLLTKKVTLKQILFDNYLITLPHIDIGEYTVSLVNNLMEFDIVQKYMVHKNYIYDHLIKPDNLIIDITAFNTNVHIPSMLNNKQIFALDKNCLNIQIKSTFAQGHKVVENQGKAFKKINKLFETDSLSGDALFISHFKDFNLTDKKFNEYANALTDYCQKRATYCKFDVFREPCDPVKEVSFDLIKKGLDILRNIDKII